MADDTPAEPVTGDADTANPAAPTETPPEPSAPSTSDDVEAMKAALKKANKEAETARLKVKEYEDAAKTQAERDAEAKTAAEAEVARLKAELLRRDVATAKGLPLELAARLQGDTEEDMAADADLLLKALTPVKADPGKADGGPQGASSPGQLTRADLQQMSPEEIVAAKAAGQLKTLLGS